MFSRHENDESACGLLAVEMQHGELWVCRVRPPQFARDGWRQRPCFSPGGVRKFTVLKAPNFMPGDRSALVNHFTHRREAFPPTSGMLSYPSRIHAPTHSPFYNDVCEWKDANRQKCVQLLHAPNSNRPGH